MENGCKLPSNSIIKTGIYTDISANYECDYILVANFSFVTYLK